MVFSAPRISSWPSRYGSNRPDPQRASAVACVGRQPAERGQPKSRRHPASYRQQRQDRADPGRHRREIAGQYSGTRKSRTEPTRILRIIAVHAVMEHPSRPHQLLMSSSVVAINEDAPPLAEAKVDIHARECLNIRSLIKTADVDRL